MENTMKAQFKTIYELTGANTPSALTFEADGASYIRNFRPRERLILLGCGHIAQPVCRYAADLGFTVAVADDRPDFANAIRFPEADTVICDDFSNAIDKLGIREDDYVAVITRGHRYDADCLRRILSGGVFPRYLGMIGSRRRVISLMKMLEEEGFSAADLERIHAPIGVPINAMTVKEIGLSIAAELVACRREGQKRRGKETVLLSDDIDPVLLNTLANDETPRVLLIVYETSGSTPVKSGAMMTVDKNLRIAGTIGGGCSEDAVMRDAYRLIGTGTERCVTIDMSNDVTDEDGMVCCGKMKVLIKDI